MTNNMKESKTNQELPWFRRMLVGIEYGPTGANDGDSIYMSGATGKEIVENLVTAKAEYCVVFSKDQNFAYYNSTAARKAPNLGDRDLLRECIDEAAKHDIAIIAYCQAQYDVSTWNKHPEWRMKDSQGADIPDRLCFNSGYVEEVKRFLAEMMAGYEEIVGFHVDMLDFGFTEPYGCWCEVCQKMFRDKHGIDLPEGVEWNDAWDKMLQFRCDSNDTFCKELTAFIRSERPELTVDYNYHGYPPFSWEVGERPVQHATNGDFSTAEGLPWVFGNNSPSLMSLFLASARPDAPVQAVTSRFVGTYHDYTVRPLADMKWEIFTYLAHGAQCTIVDKANYEGTLDSVAFERMGEVFGEARDKREYFGHDPIREVGVYYSSRSRDWYGREDNTKYYAAFAGAHKALTQSHISMGMIMDENASIDKLRKFQVVYIPNAAILNAAEVSLFEEYVSTGGKLLITGMTGLYDRQGNLKESSDIENLIGARFVESITEHADNYIKFPAAMADGVGNEFLADIPGDWSMLTFGSVAGFELAGGKGFGDILAGHRSKEGVVNVWGQLMSAGKKIGPAVIVNKFGEGEVVYVPALPDAAFAEEYRMPEHRNLIRNLVRHLNPEPKFSITAPLNVETVTTYDDDKHRTLVHLMAFNAPAPSAIGKFGEGRKVYPPLMEEALQYTAHIQLSKPFKRAILADGRVLPVDGERIILSTSEIHEIVIIEH